MANRFDFVLYFHLDHALVVDWCAVEAWREVAVYVNLVHAQDHRLGGAYFAAVELDRVQFGNSQVEFAQSPG
jgi:hypothetical protein